MGSDGGEMSIREATDGMENGREATDGMENGRFNSITRFNQIAPTTPVDAADLSRRRRSPSFTGKLAAILFFTHQLAALVLIIILAAHGLPAHSKSFHPSHWFPPLLTSATASAPVAFLWFLLALHRPAKALRAALWLAPSLACAIAVLLLADDSASSLAVAVLFLLLALVLLLYGCWISRRLRHAGEILSAAGSAVRPTLALAKFIALALLAGLLYFYFWTLGAGGAAADRSPRFVPLYALLLLLTLAWTMQTIRYAVHVAVAQLAYARLAWGAEAPAPAALEPAFARRVFGEVCYGAAVMPVVAVARGAARAMQQLSSDPDEFLFSCSSCFLGVADWMVTRGNRWGFVYVAVHGKALGSASAEAWELFAKQGMRRLIDLDLTGTFCFLCGVAGGGAAAAVAGAWVMATGKSHVAEVTVYAFVNGYFMTRIAMAWPQACVAAYHVAFAENPQNNRLGSCVRDRLRELQ